VEVLQFSIEANFLLYLFVVTFCLRDTGYPSTGGMRAREAERFPEPVLRWKYVEALPVFPVRPISGVFIKTE
jgi:hypothetical protein